MAATGLVLPEDRAAAARLLISPHQGLIGSASLKNRKGYSGRRFNDLIAVANVCVGFLSRLYKPVGFYIWDSIVNSINAKPPLFIGSYLLRVLSTFSQPQ
jgi:hypothetical protein